MALPTSGPISISQIRTELGTTNGSLRTLSNLAGKSSPDAMSEFYGYAHSVADPTNVQIGYDGTYLYGTWDNPSGYNVEIIWHDPIWGDQQYFPGAVTSHTYMDNGSPTSGYEYTYEVRFYNGSLYSNWVSSPTWN